jgi:hypothetical protein
MVVSVAQTAWLFKCFQKGRKDVDDSGTGWPKQPPRQNWQTKYATYTQETAEWQSEWLADDPTVNKE